MINAQQMKAEKSRRRGEEKEEKKEYMDSCLVGSGRYTNTKRERLEQKIDWLYRKQMNLVWQGKEL